MSILEKVKANPIGTSNLIYLIFPALSLSVLGHKGPLWSGILITVLFTVSYLIMIYDDLSKKIILRRTLLVIHFLGIFYFVGFFNASHLLFFFYGAYIICISIEDELSRSVHVCKCICIHYFYNWIR